MADKTYDHMDQSTSILKVGSIEEYAANNGYKEIPRMDYDSLLEELKSLEGADIIVEYSDSSRRTIIEGPLSVARMGKISVVDGKIKIKSTIGALPNAVEYQVSMEQSTTITHPANSLELFDIYVRR